MLFNLFCYGAPLKMFWRAHAPYLLKTKTDVKSDMKIILQRDYYTTMLHKTHNKFEEIIFDGFFVVACY